MPQVRIMALLIYVVTEGQTLIVQCSNILKSSFVVSICPSVSYVEFLVGYSLYF